MGRKPPQIRARFTGGDDVPDFEFPFPQAGLDFGEAEFHALAVHLQFLRFAPRKMGQGNACGCSILISPCIFECPSAISGCREEQRSPAPIAWLNMIGFHIALRCPLAERSSPVRR
jgi:hypothetical protein